MAGSRPFPSQLAANFLLVMRDGAVVNSNAIYTLRIMYPITMHVICFSHVLDLAGRTFQTSNLAKFMVGVEVFLHSRTGSSYLKKELPTYLVVAEGVTESVDLLEWWEMHEEKLPYLAIAEATGSAMSAIFSCC